MRANVDTQCGSSCRSCRRTSRRRGPPTAEAASGGEKRLPRSAKAAEGHQPGTEHPPQTRLQGDRKTELAGWLETRSRDEDLYRRLPEPSLGPLHRVFASFGFLERAAAGASLPCSGAYRCAGGLDWRSGHVRELGDATVWPRRGLRLARRKQRSAICSLFVERFLFCGFFENV